MLSSNLGLRDDQLKRIAAIGLINGMLQDTDSLEQVSGHLDLSGEVRRVGEDLLGLGGELHSLATLITILHGRLDPRNLLAFIEDLINVGVKHVGTTVDGGETSKSLRKLTKTVERIDVGRLSIACHRVHIKTNAVDGLGGHSSLGDIEIRLIQRHRVADEVAGVVFEAEFVVYILHRTLSNIQAWMM